VKHISKSITFLVDELVGSINSHFVEHLFFIETNFQSRILLKKNHFDEITKIKEKFTLEQDNRNRQENLQNRVDHLVKLLEQSNDT
jgi:hypothetical protein